MQIILTVVHLFLALGIIGLVLMQHGKGADAGAAFGSGASGTVFGAQGASNFLSRTTAILAALFFVTSIALGYFAMKQDGGRDIMAGFSEDESKAVPAKEEKPAETDMPPVTLMGNGNPAESDDMPPVATEGSEPDQGAVMIQALEPAVADKSAEGTPEVTATEEAVPDAATSEEVPTTEASVTETAVPEASAPEVEQPAAEIQGEKAGAEAAPEKPTTSSEVPKAE